MRRELSNTQLFCLRVLDRRGTTNAGTIALARWPKTKCLGRKTKTIERHLEQLMRSGYVRKFAPLYAVTEAGAAAAKTATQRDRPPVMRIAR